LTKALPTAQLNILYKTAVIGFVSRPNEALSLTLSDLPPGFSLAKCTYRTTAASSVINCPLIGIPTASGSYQISATLANPHQTATVKIPLTILK